MPGRREDQRMIRAPSTPRPALKPSTSTIPVCTPTTLSPHGCLYEIAFERSCAHAYLEDPAIERSSPLQTAVDASCFQDGGRGATIVL